MDFITIFGFGLGIGLLYFGANEGGGLGVFMNIHGLSIVMGGTFAMTLVNASSSALWQTLRACVLLFFPPRETPLSTIIVAVRQLADQAKSSGIMAIQRADAKLGEGFLGRAANVAVMSGDAELTRSILEEDILQMRLRHQTVIGVLRTVGVISPMIGLLGTLIGIVSVLQQITEPAKVGPAMATALSTAFYGIFVAAFFAVPVAGKLRERSNRETIVKQLLVEGIVGILKGEPPYVLELRLRSFVGDKGAPAQSAPFPGKAAA